MYRRPRAVVEAERFLEQYGTTSPPVPVEEIAAWLGIQVVRAPSSGSESAFLVRDGRRTIIGVNSRQTRRRQRFSIAHELGHWQLHDGRPLIVDHTIRINKRDDLSSAATDIEEIEANSFAAGLLMPKNWVQASADREQLLGVVDRDQLTLSLAKEFDVSTEAIRFRLINLGIFSG
ncbi:ImmA/IrrE family metallo-endopeptidase [Amycolatopsis sp. WQ 127309]|uniref:ImmA/IrrE family metallo-endopeptidase n=1 Tax=Amycolatopsis sp. WQ 127309 TaxID=2932773 RepID=UPI001FF1C243|nr:ImmA/IrrE family metallo-endopeptidase [Amycolatopsis sp. WQ 127309]UOZ10200.1 ImmA/IrrE family metallo-endopeptidase [Amycolatopsis sp. WQ 127309]